MIQIKPDISKKILTVTCVLLFVYAVVRACCVSLTHDEGLTYNLVKDQDYFGFTANNHLLNTWCMAIFTSIFGDKELVLRLASILLFAVYLFFSAKLFLKFTRLIFILFAIPLVFLNPFVMDFFALARGYGISVGFMMASVYYLLRSTFSSEQSTSELVKNFFFSSLFAAGALIANLSLVNFYIALLAVYGWDYFLIIRKNKTERNLLKFFTVLGLAGIPLFFSLTRLLVLKEANDLYVGATDFDETISTLIERSSYLMPYPVWFTELLQAFIIYIFPVGLIITLLRKNYGGPLFKLGALITLMLLGFEAEHYLFSTLFPIGRTGVYFIPLFGLFLTYLFIQFIENRKANQQNVFLVAGFVICSLPLTLHFFKTMNISQTFEWRYDKHTKEVVMKINEQDKNAVLGHNWIFGPSIHYYILSRNLSVTPVKLEGQGYDQDYIYEFNEQLTDSSLIPLKEFKDTGSGIYKPTE